jgi:hypothetical protein
MQRSTAQHTCGARSFQVRDVNSSSGTSGWCAYSKSTIIGANVERVMNPALAARDTHLLDDHHQR